MTNIMIVGVLLVSTLCEGFLILDPDTEKVDYKSGYKIVSINGENVGEPETFREITSEEEYSKDDVEISSIIPALRKGLKKVKISASYSMLGFLNSILTSSCRRGFLIKLISKD